MIFTNVFFETTNPNTSYNRLLNIANPCRNIGENGDILDKNQII